MAQKKITVLAGMLSFVLLISFGALALPKDQSGNKYSRKDLDDLMDKVWKKTEINLETLRDYVFREKEVWENRSRRESRKLPNNCLREYSWIVRAGYLVRSPASVNGNEISAAEQSAAEAEWLKEQHRRGAKRNSLDLLVDLFRDRDKLIGKPPYRKTFGKWEDYFSFKFKPGIYRYEGEREFEGRKLVVVSCDFRNTSLAMLILPEKHQLVRLSIIYAMEDRSIRQQNETIMVMDEPLEGVWLPQKFYAYGKSDSQNWNTEFLYSRDFYDYRKSEVNAKFWFEDVSTKILYEKEEPRPKK